MNSGHYSNTGNSSQAVKVRKVDECFMQLDCSYDVLRRISPHFRFQIPNARFHPKVKNGFWDGYINLIQNDRKLYLGLLPKLVEVCALLELKLELDKQPCESWGFFNPEVSEEAISELARTCIFEPKDYQAKAALLCLRNQRQVIVSPTASGKSFIIYLVTKYLIPTRKVLIIVPTIGLTSQMREDFEDYDPDVDHSIYEISAGVEKPDNIESEIVISTWQSIQKMPEEWFHQFGAVIVDEVHEATKIVDKKLVIVNIMEKCVNATYRLGFTGSLESDAVDKLVLTGIFGPITEVVTTHELMKRKDIAQSKIICLVLKYGPKDRKRLTAAKKGKESTQAFQEEVKFLQEHNNRTKFLKNLIESRKGNSLVLFDKINYGKHLHEILDRESHLVYGNTTKTVRNELRKTCEKRDDMVIVASLGTFKRGVNIKNLHTIIRECLIKEPNTVKQFIGRGLRTHASKDHLEYFDIIDDLTVNAPNFAMRQFQERLKLYYKEKHPVKIIEVELADDESNLNQA